MSKINNKLVLITGGAAGIGKIMGRIVLEKGGQLIIWDINQEKINETILELSKIGKVNGFKVDVSNTKMVKDIAAKVKNEIGKIDILINNAGIVVGKYFHEHSEQDILRTMNINTNAPMFITQEFLGDMMTRNSGHICNIASTAGIISNPKMSVYAASKWAALGWSDSLRLEMKQLKKSIKVTTILPYYINTGMFDGVKSRIPILEPEVVAKQIITAIEKNKIMLTTPSWVYRITRFGQAIMPIRLFDWFAGSVLGIYSTMSHFQGHK